MDKLEVKGHVALLERPAEVEKPPFSDTSLRGIRAEIIRDILTGGLKSSERLINELRPYLRSHDPIVFGDETQPHIDGVIIRPGDTEKLKQEFYDSLYWSCAALPTVAERSYPDDFLLAGSASKRRNYWGPITAEKKKIITQRLAVLVSGNC